VPKEQIGRESFFMTSLPQISRFRRRAETDGRFVFWLSLRLSHSCKDGLAMSNTFQKRLRTKTTTSRPCCWVRMAPSLLYQLWTSRNESDTPLDVGDKLQFAASWFYVPRAASLVNGFGRRRGIV